MHRFFEDFPTGWTYESAPRTLETAEIVAFAREWDPQRYHVDEAAARATPFGGLIASGWQTGCLAMRLMCDGYLADSSCIASPGFDELRWLKPVRPGDTLTGWVVCADKVPSRSRPTMGVIHEHWQVTNQNGELVMTTKGINMVLRRPA